jgi:hypothetical protein
MNRRQLLAAAAAAAAAAAPTALHAEHNEDHDGIVGSWFGTVTATNPPLGTFEEMASFHADGIVIESRRYLIKGTPLGDLLETTGHGAWTRTGPRAFEAFFRFFLQNFDTGAPIGTDNIRLALRRSRNGASLAGTFVSQIKDTAGTVVFQVEGTYSATRIGV